MDVLLLPAAPHPSQRRGPGVFKLREAQAVEDVINSGSGGHLPQRHKVVIKTRTHSLLSKSAVVVFLAEQADDPSGKTFTQGACKAWTP